jgi:hypothetical protein
MDNNMSRKRARGVYNDSIVQSFTKNRKDDRITADIENMMNPTHDGGGHEAVGLQGGGAGAGEGDVAVDMQQEDEVGSVFELGLELGSITTPILVVA